MEKHSTNYFDTFIEVSEDSKAECGTKPPTKEKRTIAEIQFELIAKNPYKYTSDDILFMVFADRNDLTKTEYKEARELFFSKGQACLRTSPLAKRYGFGIHFDGNGKIAIYGVETLEYEKYIADEKLKKIKAVRSKR
ncbi:hypothetical protein GGR32_001299 [Mesonia hippocampi]|uniref:Uncharacterized protein n=1 Tax=Mesonia hippocampi TaxID=1628250 RepID=A0A840ELK6_9FLAO|nr:DUF6157 family protein [Mesonia hippocampi]MBB4119008.1 hypothetical protein [Mesonia hippocampi]